MKKWRYTAVLAMTLMLFVVCGQSAHAAIRSVKITVPSCE